MRLGWVAVLALAGVLALAWWLARDPPEQRQQRGQRAQAAAQAAYEDAQPVLYRWRDARGVRQVTDHPPPAGVPYDKVDMHPREGIQVDGRKR